MPPKKTIFVAVPLAPSFLLPGSCFRNTTKSSTLIQKRSFGIRSIDPPRQNRYNVSANLLSTPKAAYERKIAADTLPLRTGALAIKRGMTAIYNSDTGERIPCTILQLERNQVVHHRTMKDHGYYAVCIGAGAKDPKNVTKD